MSIYIHIIFILFYRYIHICCIVLYHIISYYIILYIYMCVCMCVCVCVCARVHVQTVTMWSHSPRHCRCLRCVTKAIRQRLRFCAPRHGFQCGRWQRSGTVRWLNRDSSGRQNWRCWEKTWSYMMVKYDEILQNMMKCDEIVRIN